MEKKYMKAKKAIIITMCSLICIMIVGYAAFATNLKINGTANITSTWKVLFTKIEEVEKVGTASAIKVPTAEGTSATFDVDLKSPGDAIVYAITVANQGTLDAIINNITLSETGSDAIKFDFQGISIGDTLAKGTSLTFEVVVFYDDSVTSQPIITDNTLKLNIDYVQDLGQTIEQDEPTWNITKLKSAILRDNQVVSDVNNKYNVTSQPETGLYYTNKNTEDNKTTYYFRGAVENNWVSFGKSYFNVCTYNGAEVAYYDEETNSFDSILNENQCKEVKVCLDNDGPYVISGDVNGEKCSQGDGTTYTNEYATWEKGEESEEILWRIVRINEDGSIRLVTQNYIGTSAFNEVTTGHAYVGYMYGDASSSVIEDNHKNINSSTVKKFVDNWYKENLLPYSSLIADAGFCGDRSIVPTDDNGFVGYGWKDRKENGTPQFKCPNQNRDLYTTSTSTKGNKSLTYPIGLLSADEVMYAGGKGFYSRSNYFLVDSTPMDLRALLWNMTPFQSSNQIAYVGRIDDTPQYSYSGVIASAESNYVGGVRPVINLNSDVEITGGYGTDVDPYVIKIN